MFEPFTDEPKPLSTIMLEIRSALAVARETKIPPMSALLKANDHSFPVIGLVSDDPA